ncbi:morn repeat protein [Thecamonas trahens ATCC 50062]|uniref:Morn repeat protein n=1 Tax=Thecamonas trahens ATCC 50062 TaxID=461836 RepID=A0A0L0DVR2_THETB|nr:morn repeat protein [Thecamonas trahens ATCC 50062]KNC55603.1 morn repeat protein [Thecamonas trahens ATCC 50062]|eukprot:XP_013761376.1 morn repeat protein [Thecamonas trahens ATCC 50062]
MAAAATAVEAMGAGPEATARRAMQAAEAASDDEEVIELETAGARELEQEHGASGGAGGASGTNMASAGPIGGTKGRGAMVEVGTVMIRYKGVYSGELRDGVPHGRGSFTTTNGDVFEGEWINGKKHGSFVCKYVSGEVFEGEFKDGRRSGHGKHMYPNGSSYEGEYVNDRRHGPGLYCTKHDFYDCQKTWMRKYSHGTLEDEREVYTKFQLISDRPGFGFGVWVSDDGTRYEGDHEDGLRHGDGTLTFADGTQWIGPFANDRRHGIGMRKTPLNEYFYEEYANGELVRSTPSDYANWRNLKWFDEGGQRQ